MLEKKVFLCPAVENFLQNHDVYRVFYNLFFKKLEKFRENSSDKIEGFIKIHSLRFGSPMNFPLHAFKSPESKEEINNLDELALIKELLESAKQYRIIEGDYESGVYKKVSQILLSNPGEYIMAVGNSPKFKLGIFSNKPTIISQMNFHTYDNKGFFKHIPHLNQDPFLLELELSIEDERKRNQKILMNMYENIFEDYQSKGAEVKKV